MMLNKADQKPTHSVSSASDFAIEAKGLRKIYKGEKGEPDKEALKDIDLQIPRGSIFGLLGPNGAGKSTFINILAGLVIKTSGTVRTWGFDIDVNPRQARVSIGVVPQELVIDVFFSPVEALEIQAGLFGVPKAQRRTMEILKAVGLDDKANAYSRNLSGGMKRRLLIAKALVHDPPVLILDEPTAGVDIELRRQLWNYVNELHERGVTIVLTTHYLEEAQALCDTIAIINNGQVVACEPTPQLLQHIKEKTLIIQPASALPSVPSSLAELDAYIRADGSLAIQYDRSNDSAGDLLTKVREAGVEIGDLRTEESDLEDIFMRLTYEAETPRS
jgi:ABC-2 type transport system ATP-binding protein